MTRMRLRDSSKIRIPGRYQEDLGPFRADRPLFVHPDVPFNPDLVQYCAHPSLPLDYPGVGPSEAAKARLETLAIEKTQFGDDVERSGEVEDVPVVATSGRATQGGTSSPDSEYRGQRDRRSQRRRESSNLNNTFTRLTASEPASRSTAPKPAGLTAANTIQMAPFVRPARVASVPWRKPGHKLTGNSNSMKNSNQYQPQWSDLSDGIKYAIVHDMTQTTPLSQAVQTLNLGHVEVASLLRLISEENRKKRKFTELLLKHGNSARIPPTEELAALCPITEGISADEVRHGRAFLKFLGLDGVAVGLGFWEGTRADFHDVHVDEGCWGLIDGFGFPDSDGKECHSLHKLRNLKGAELLLRLDPPAKTLNPQRLKSGSAPPARATRLEPVRVPPAGGLHPVNYTVAGKSGRWYSALDKSDWPAWEALHDAGIVPEVGLIVMTANSLVPDEVAFLSPEDLETLSAAQSADMFGSLPADDSHIMGWEEAHPLAPEAEALLPVWRHNEFEDDCDFEIFIDSPVKQNEEVAEQPQHRTGSSFAIVESTATRTISEEQASQASVILENRDHDIENVLPTQPSSLQAPAASHQPSSGEHTGPCFDIDAAMLAVNQFLTAPRLAVRQLSPEIAASVAEITARAANARHRVRFEDEPSQRSPAVEIGDTPAINELDNLLEEADIAVPKTKRGRGRGTRIYNDEEDDDEYKPRTPTVRKSGARTPRARAAGAASSRQEIPVTTTSGTKKRTRDDSLTADEAPKRRRQKAADNTATSVTCAIGTPRKKMLFDPEVHGPSGSATPGTSLASNPFSRGDTTHADQPMNPTAPNTPSSPGTRSLGGKDPEQTALLEQTATPTPGRHMERKPSGDATPQTPAIRLVIRPSKLAHGGSSPSTRLAPQVGKSPRPDTSSGDEDEGAGAQEHRKPAKLRTYKSKLDESGQPIERMRRKPTPELVESGLLKKHPRGHRPGSRAGTGKDPNQPTPRRGYPAFTCEGDRLLRSTEGEIMTRAELEEAYPHDQRIYRSGGNLGGGKFEIIGTGVFWSFVPESELQAASEEHRRRRQRTAIRDVGMSDDTCVNAPTASRDSNSKDPSLTQNATLSKPASPENKTTPQPGLGTPVGKPKQTKLRLYRRNTPSHKTVTTSTIAVPRFRAPHPPNKMTPGAVAARVRELDERCVRYHVATRDQFDSDEAFLAYAESMLPLLYPDLAGGREGLTSPPPPPPPGLESNRSFI
ncbi:hypothetical protein VTH82DRAFT_2061 [Thermothelomyces myriococcoides]